LTVVDENDDVKIRIEWLQELAGRQGFESRPGGLCM
jgi:hypothetical protein